MNYNYKIAIKEGNYACESSQKAEEADNYTGGLFNVSKFPIIVAFGSNSALCSLQVDAAEKLKDIVKSLYDFSKLVTGDDDSGTGNALEELIIQSMDEEQIWQQLELNNEEIVDQSLKNVAAVLTVNKTKLKIPYKSDEKAEEESETNQKKDEASELDEDFDEGSQSDQDVVEEPIKQKKSKPSIVDDQFFKLSEMEEFLQMEDKKEMKRGKGRVEDDSDSEVDLFQDFSDEEDSVS